jgi:hypothetical protein
VSAPNAAAASFPDFPARGNRPLTAYHARIRALADQIPAEHRDALSDFPRATADAATDAAEELHP